jgi:hypothetical protein
MANIVARIVEKHMGKIFSNFAAGKNATSSIFKGEGTANDLEFNKAFINGFLPLSFSATRATCKVLKWKLSLMSKTPITLVFTGVNIEVTGLPPGQQRSAWKKKKKKRSKKQKERQSKKQALLQGIKLQLHDVSFKVIMMPEHGGAGAQDVRPYLQLDITQMRMHSANSQFHEVSDTSKIYVINPAVGEAMSFKKLEISGCSLYVYDPAAYNTARHNTGAGASKKPVVLWDSVAVQAKMSTKRKCQSWEVLAFKLEVELPQLSCSLSRLEVFMAKLVFSSLRYTLSLAKAKEDGGGGGGGGKMEEELGEKDTKEEKDDDEEAALGSLLEQHGEVVLDDEESSENKQWCAHVDNSIHLGIKHLEINAVPEVCVYVHTSVWKYDKVFV